MKCPNKVCTGSLAPNLRECPACGTDGGAPNVRLACRQEEVVELELRYSRAKIDSADAGFDSDFDTFVDLVTNSDAVICMPGVRLLELLNGKSLLSTFSLELEARSRIPQDNRFDAMRASVESAFFPNFSEQIRFAALTITDIGQAAYGVCSVLLKKNAIANRSSVFEFPLFAFADNNNQKLGQEIPFGHRASWENRAKLAGAKLGTKCRGLDRDGMAKLLLPEPKDTLSDCIEVHVYQSINSHSIAHITLTQPREETDALLQDVLIKELAKQNIPCRDAR